MENKDGQSIKKKTLRIRRRGSKARSHSFSLQKVHKNSPAVPKLQHADGQTKIIYIYIYTYLLFLRMSIRKPVIRKEDQKIFIVS